MPEVENLVQLRWLSLTYLDPPRGWLGRVSPNCQLVIQCLNSLGVIRFEIADLLLELDSREHFLCAICISLRLELLTQTRAW